VESSRDRSTDGREARMATVERGCLAIGDIAGYTTYLAGVELEHSQDVLADLMGVVVMQMRGLLHLAKLEGDAVFCYNREDEATGPMLLTMTESCYSAFARRLMNIRLRTTCECDACRLIPRLNLKFAIHFGQYVAHDVAGSRELMGRDVIVVHRLLKNSVKEKTGLRGYALYTQAAMQRFGLDPASLGAARTHGDLRRCRRDRRVRVRPGGSLAGGAAAARRLHRPGRGGHTRGCRDGCGAGAGVGLSDFSGEAAAVAARYPARGSAQSSRAPRGRDHQPLRAWGIRRR